MSKNAVAALLACKNLCIVGLSRSPEKASHQVAAYLKEHGYQLTAVSPHGTDVMDIPCFMAISAIPMPDAQKIEVFVIFRPNEEVRGIVAEILQLSTHFPKVKGVWLQEGITYPEGEGLAENAQLLLVQDRCFKKEHQKAQNSRFKP